MREGGVMKFHFHKWYDVADTGKHLYQECGRCGRRRCLLATRGAYQPIAASWLRGEHDWGQKPELKNLPRTWISAVQKPRD